MIKDLTYYIIPSIFKHNIKKWHLDLLDVTKIKEDLYTYLDEEDILISATNVDSWDSNPDTITLNLMLDEDWEDKYISIHIGWRKNYTFQYVWFYGTNDEYDSIYYTVGEEND